MTWEDRLKQLISPTENKFPYRVVQIKPNRKRDDEIYLLSGQEEAIAANGSLFLALYDLAERDRIDFDEWFAQWELGFPLLNAYRELGNYQLVGNTPWRVFDKRPRFRDWTPPELKNLGYRTIEYWRDRSVEKKSVVLSGTSADLIRHVIQLEYEGGGSNNTSDKTVYLVESRIGFPKIKLFFKENILDVEPGYRAVEAELKITIMKSEWKNISNISKNDIEQLARAVKNVFYDFSFKKGKLTCSYKNLEQGYDNWVYVRNKDEGMRVMTALVGVQGHTLDRRRLNFTETDDEVGAYPIVPATVTALGEQLKLSRKRPIAEVKFTHAKIFLPGLSDWLGLVDSAGNIFKSNDNLI
jgi:hypothetical protein